MKKLFKEFRDFIAKGNVIDMAIGVIIGGAFGKIVTSLVNDVIMPLVSLALGGNSLTSLSLVLNGAERYLADGSVNPAALLWHYGSFIQSIIDFLIIALCVFFILKIVVTLQKSAKAAKDVLQKEVIDKLVAPEKAEAENAEAISPEVTEAAVEPEAATAPVTEVPADANAEMIALLKEIRDALNK